MIENKNIHRYKRGIFSPLFAMLKYDKTFLKFKFSTFGSEKNYFYYSTMRSNFLEHLSKFLLRRGFFYFFHLFVKILLRRSDGKSAKGKKVHWEFSNVTDIKNKRWKKISLK